MNASSVSPTPTFDEMRRILRDRHALDDYDVAHRSAKLGHARPLFNMRLGEGSGAALAAPILKAAAACHNGMATFAQAGVSSKH